ncbi:MAG TPA: hypothetical protein PKC72_01890 [Chitinophagaceae bacterium]|nr:hypothetical protein [Chitinophagaceae bacterium]
MQTINVSLNDFVIERKVNTQDLYAITSENWDKVRNHRRYEFNKGQTVPFKVDCFKLKFSPETESYDITREIASIDHSDLIGVLIKIV